MTSGRPSSRRSPSECSRRSTSTAWPGTLGEAGRADHAAPALRPPRVQLGELAPAPRSGRHGLDLPRH
eukprot:10206305-Alexandrium_andersonii.AAC.1